ncbi:MAG: hypothetical protein CME33_04955 [Gimesia sp.]|nr:hypothetical protein [Gimesia sp.]
MERYGASCRYLLRACKEYRWLAPFRSEWCADDTDWGWARIKFGSSPYFLSVGFDFFVVDNSDGEVLSVPIVRDIGLILARRADTWDGPYEEQGWFCCSDLCVCPDSFLSPLATPNYIRGYPFFLEN